MNIRVIFSVLILVLLSISAQATFQEASKLYDEQKFEQAYKMFFDLAQIGHKPSQFNIGIMHLEGTGAKKDLIKAYSWIKLADEVKGEEQALLSDIKSKIPTKEAKLIESYHANIHSKYSNQAIKQAYAPEIRDNEKKVSSPAPIEQKPAEYPIRAQIEGYTGWVLFDFDLSSSGYPIDIQVVDSFPKGLFVKASLKAVKRWRFEPHETEKRYKYKMDFRLEGLGNDDRRQYKELKSIKDEALEGNPSSQYLHARYGGYNFSEGADFSPATWHYEAARNGVLNAQYELAERLLEGDGCEVDPDKAFNWLKVSAENDFALSQFKLAKLAYKNGEKEKTTTWLRKALKSNSEIESIDSERLAYQLVDFIYSNKIQGMEPRQILEQLELANEGNITNPVKFFQYYSFVYESLGELDESIDYLEEAVETLEDLGEETIPQDMLDRLALLETKAS